MQTSNVHLLDGLWDAVDIGQIEQRIGMNGKGREVRILAAG